MYNTVMKVLFLASSGYIVYLMKYKRPICSSYDKVQDSFNVLYLIVPCVIVGLGVHMMQIYLYEDSFSLFEVFWIFSIYLEAVAIVPQLKVLQMFAQSHSGKH